MWHFFSKSVQGTILVTDVIDLFFGNNCGIIICRACFFVEDKFQSYIADI